MIEVEARAGVVSRARTLSERLAIARSTDPATAAPLAAAGLKHLELWSRAFAPGGRDAFVRRLAWDDLSLEHAAVALSDAPGFERDDDGWLTRAEQLAADLRPEPPVDPELPFAEIWSAWAHAGWRALLRRRPSAEAELGASAAALRRQLARELTRTGAMALHAAFCEGGRYDEFVRASLADGCLSLGRAYPVWLRHLLIICEAWVDAADELLARLDADRAAIHDTFRLAASRIVDIEPGLSDPHHGRRRVARLVFESGLRLIYKPRSVSGEHALNALVAWLAARGVAPALPAVAVLDRGSHGWMADVPCHAFTSRDEVEDYYRRAGALLCLMHVLRGRDLHWENVVASRTGPVIVDAELLLQPVAEDEPPVSPLDTGLLSCLQTGPDGEIVDVGGFRGDRMSRGPTAERVWTGMGTDAIAVGEEFRPIGPRQNRVVLSGAVQDPGDYADTFLAGFAAMYRGLIANREALLAPGGPIASLSGVRARVLVRPSHHYAAALHALADPRFQRDGRRWGCSLETLNRRYRFSAARPRTWIFTAVERRALEGLDLPSFWTPADRTDVLSGDEVIAPAFFRRSGLDAVRSLIRELDEDDLARQCSTLRRALGQSTRSRFSTPLRLPAEESGVQDHRAALVATAEWIAHELARRQGGSANEPSLESLRLYDGGSGPAVMFAALAAATGDARWREATVRAAAPLTRLELPAAFPTGATTGAGSVIYALTLIASLTGESSYLESATRLSERLTDEVLGGDAGCDVSSGVAGALLACLALDRARPGAAAMARAMRCAQLLVDRLEPAGEGAAWAAPGMAPRAGFAHGAAGIAYALARLYAVTQDAVLPPVIAAAHAFERGVFSVADRNWPAAGPHAGDGAALMTAWCNGAPGIGLERAFAATVLDDPAFAGEIGVAIEATARVGAAQADHLCCGNLGRADVLLTIGQLLPSRDPMRMAMQIAGIVVARARDRGHFRLATAGAEYEVFTPGFFTGLSGIGYTLLRFADPKRLPSVLALGSDWRESRYADAHT